MTEGGQPGGCSPWPGVWAFPEELGATSWGDPGDTEDLLLTPRQRANALGQQWGRGALSSPGASVPYKEEAMFDSVTLWFESLWGPPEHRWGLLRPQA